jgi:Flp pilus assembly protein TadD
MRVAMRGVGRASSLLVFVVIVALIGCGRGTPAREPVTFSTDVAPILYGRCVTCHRPGQVGPFALLSYEDARSRAQQIAAMTGARRMPPWLPDPSDPPFIAERRLSPQEIEILQRWATAGAPEGDPARAPAPPSFPAGWTYGTPDLVVEMPRPYVLRPGGHDVYRNVILPVTVPENRFVRAVEFNPGTRVVHHAVIRIDRTGVSRQRDADDPEPGFEGMVATDVQDPDGHFIGWAPGRGPIVAPEGMPWRLDRGSDLVIELHLMPSNEPTSVKPRLALYFTDKPPIANPVMLVMGSKAIDIPPGQANYIVEDRYQLPVQVDLLSLYPHAHFLGREMSIQAILPDGHTRSLLHIPQWNFQWQQDYRYTTPVALPQGTTIVMRYTYDNSEQNTANPHRPVHRVMWGPQSSDEMGNLGVQVLPRSTADAAMLVASFAQHAARIDVDGAEILLKKDPDSAANEALVGSSYLQVGRVADAVPHLERAIRLDPRLANAENFLGGAQLTLGRTSEAVVHFRRAVTLSPRDEHLRFNLARALDAAGDAPGAMQSLREALAINPGLAEAHEQLGVLLFERGRVADATAHLTDAVRLAPRSATAHSALGGALAQAGRFDEAIVQLEQALAIDPDDPVARENLARIPRR